jgi:hypothetical protein
MRLDRHRSHARHLLELVTLFARLPERSVVYSIYSREFINDKKVLEPFIEYWVLVSWYGLAEFPLFFFAGSGPADFFLKLVDFSRFDSFRILSSGLLSSNLV